MRVRVAAAIAASVVCSGVAASAATAAPTTGGPPLPQGIGGAKVEQFAAGLHTPTSFAFGGGNVFEGDGGAENGSGPPTGGGVYVLKAGKGLLIPGSPTFVGGLAWHNGALYVSGGTFTAQGPVWQLLKWSGWNGTTFARQTVIYTAPSGFDGFNGIAFGANGRLYVGVDVGLTDGNDHGPATMSPYLYDILSIHPNGQGLKVVATGIRQPWQLAFPHGSSSPFVSALGQDKGAQNPPDFILRVKPGDKYGFPTCNWTVASNCKGFARPFKMFGPHTDIMGLAIIGQRLYVTSFLGTAGQGPGGEVLSMPLSGGPLKPVVKGFVAPVVGLGARGRSLWVGELTGQVFRVTP
jgi:glucose/arabinose dehydrogenase